MRLIFIRHAEPNYEIDSLTPAGFREAELLAQRVARWDVTDFFLSPLGRAQDTARPSLEAMGRSGETLPWLREFSCGKYIMPDRPLKVKSVPWDFLPEYWTVRPEFYEKDHWMEAQVMQAQPQKIENRFAEVTDGVDGILRRYGYTRRGNLYHVTDGAQRDATLVFFCHLGVTGAAVGHILGVAPPVLWHSFLLAPSSVTVLNTEEVVPGVASFRCQCMGDTAHLYRSGEPVSPMAAFGPVFDESDR